MLDSGAVSDFYIQSILAFLEHQCIGCLFGFIEPAKIVCYGRKTGFLDFCQQRFMEGQGELGQILPQTLLAVMLRDELNTTAQAVVEVRMQS